MILPMEYKKIIEAEDDIFNKEYSSGEYCHETSFRWGFEEGVTWCNTQIPKLPDNLDKATEDYMNTLRPIEFSSPHIFVDWQVRDAFKSGAQWKTKQMEQLLECSKQLYNDIDSCIINLLKAREQHDPQKEGKALFQMESLMVQTQQHLTCIVDDLTTL